MKVDVLASLGAQLARGGASVTFADDGEFGARLTLGQIIKGRVLRSYEGGRHLVDFGGRERIVDSAVPLRPDEVFHGRVVGLGEQVTLQKLISDPSLPQPPATPDVPRISGDTLAVLFERYRAEVPAAQLESAAAVVARLPQPQTAALAALVLAKLGLPLEAAWIRALHSRLAGTGRDDAVRMSLRLETAAPEPTLLEAAVPALAAALAAGVSNPTANGQRGVAADGDPPPRDPASWILNRQTRGAVAHRVGTLPLLVDGRLVELDVALFEEGREQGREPGREPGRDESAPDTATMRHRQIVIALDTPSLGRVEVRARMVGTRMEVSLATTSSENTLALSLHSARLSADLQALGWQLDGLDYQTRMPQAGAGPLHSVVEHIINPGSVSRLV